MIKVEIDLPVYNEESCLKQNVISLINFLESNDFDFDWKIVIIDNASIDKTAEIASDLSDKHAKVEYFRIKEKGRGRALREAWKMSDSDVVCYMDIDLSTNLSAFPKLINVVVSEEYDIAIGSRLLKESVVKRSLKRNITSKIYVFLFKIFFNISFSDPQCGFKALNRKIIENILPYVIDQKWFFDSELLFRCQKSGYRIGEVPVIWTEDKKSKVKILSTAINYLFSLIRLKKEFNRKI